MRKPRNIVYSLSLPLPASKTLRTPGMMASIIADAVGMKGVPLVGSYSILILSVCHTRLNVSTRSVHLRTRQMSGVNINPAPDTYLALVA